jgi:hypothetical protein
MQLQVCSPHIILKKNRHLRQYRLDCFPEAWNQFQSSARESEIDVPFVKPGFLALIAAQRMKRR